MTVVNKSGNTAEDNQEALLTCRLLLLTIFFTTPTLGGLVKCWVRCLGLGKEDDCV